MKIKRKPRSFYFDSPCGLVKTRHNSSKYSAILHNKTSNKIYVFCQKKNSLEGVQFPRSSRVSRAYSRFRPFASPSVFVWMLAIKQTTVYQPNASRDIEVMLFDNISGRNAIHWWVAKEELRRNFSRRYDSDKSKQHNESNTIPLNLPPRESLFYKRLANVSGLFLDPSHTSRQNKQFLSSPQWVMGSCQCLCCVISLGQNLQRHRQKFRQDFIKSLVSVPKIKPLLHLDENQK